MNMNERIPLEEWKAKKQAEVWPMVFHEFEPETAELDIKSGNMVPESIYGLKLVSWFEENMERGLPPLYGTILVFDSETGVPLGLLDAGYLTGLRTGRRFALACPLSVRCVAADPGSGEITLALSGAPLPPPPAESETRRRKGRKKPAGRRPMHLPAKKRRRR